MTPSSKDHGSSSTGRRRWGDEEQGGVLDLCGSENDTFSIPLPKKATIERLKKWRQATLVLNASRRFRYTLDLKRVKEKEEIRQKIRAHAQAVRAALLFKEAGEKHLDVPMTPSSKDHGSSLTGRRRRGDEEQGGVLDLCGSENDTFSIPLPKKATIERLKKWRAGWYNLIKPSKNAQQGFTEDMEDAIPSVVAEPLGSQQTSEITHETSAVIYKRMSDDHTMHTAVLAWAPVGIGAVVVASGLLYCFLDWFHVI